MLIGVRKAYASRGDSNLTRFVKDPSIAKKPPRHQQKFDFAANPKIQSGNTLFPSTVKAPGDVKRLLVSGKDNIKIGYEVRKGKLRGYRIFTLSLEERATCPRSCHHWQNCYGNNMPFAKRLMHGPDLLDKLDSEIQGLLSVKNRAGVLIRLHALGDFYSISYVNFWHSMLHAFPNLAVFGYTAHPPKSPIGLRLAGLQAMFPEQVWIRYSNGGMADNCTISIVNDTVPTGAFRCPEQTGKSQCCATCAVCWSSRKNVAFREH